MKKIAKQYCEEGLYPIPVQYKEKNPTVAGWPNLKVTTDNVDQYFNSKETNIGILLGDGLIDIDIDDERLLGLAKDILPPSGLVFGRHQNLPLTIYMNQNTRKVNDIR